MGSVNAQGLTEDSGDAAISLMLAEAEMTRFRDGTLPQRQSIRGLARLNDTAMPQSTQHQSLASLLGQSQLAVTVEPESGERYQGIVNAQSPTLAESIEDYFVQSEQLATQLHLFANDTQAVGLLLQEMPNHGGKSERFPIGFEDQMQAQFWEEISVIARSITSDEMFSLAAEDCLHRLFHKHAYEISEPVPVGFACSCSQERTGSALENIAMDALEAILQEDGEIVMDCEFCSSRYRFDRTAVELIKMGNQPGRLN